MFKKSQLRVFATSLTAVGFLVIGISGVMMYFHWNDSFVKALHENLGVAFVIFALLHVIYNWASMKSYFTKKVFLGITVLILGISGGFVYSASSQSSGANPKTVLIDSMLNAPIDQAFIVLGNDMQSAQEKLAVAGLSFNDEQSLKELATTNKTSPFKIVGVLTQK